MRLTNLSTNDSIDLPDDLYDAKELDWSNVVSTYQRAIDGTLHIHQSVRKHGQPYSLSARDDMAWLTRATVNELRTWANLPNTKFRLDYVRDGRQKSIVVMFNHENNPINAKPVKNNNSPNLDDYFIVTINLIQVQ